MPATPASSFTLPPLPLAGWKGTRDRLHRWARLAGAVLRQRAPPRQRHWQLSLRATARGLTTGPFPVPAGAAEIVLDLVAESVTVSASDGWEMRLALAADPSGPAREGLAAGLAELGIEVELPTFDQRALDLYDTAAAARYLRVLAALHGVLRTLQGELEEHGEVSPVQLWPHQFDLALAWLSGGRERGDGASTAERAELALGFSTGDEHDPEPYLYAIRSPWVEGLERRALPAGRWHGGAWHGGFLPWSEVCAAADPLASAASFWRGAWRTLEPRATARDGEPPAAVEHARG